MLIFGFRGYRCLSSTLCLVPSVRPFSCSGELTAKQCFGHLEQGITWADFDEARAAGLNIPHYTELWRAAVLTILITFVRYVCERTVFVWLGNSLMRGRAAQLCMRITAIPP